MSEILFEGELDSLSDLQKEFMCKALHTRGLKANKIQIETFGKAGDNYAANVKKITAELSDGKIFKMVAKIAPTSEMARASMCTDILFANESVMYNDVLPKFAELQTVGGIPFEDIFRYPKFYGNSLEHLNEIMLLEDLKESNFEMLDRFKPLTNEYVRLILKKFAVLHSLSFVLKKRDPDTFSSCIGKLKDYYSYISVNPESKQYFSTLETDTISILVDEKYKRVVRGTVAQLSKHYSGISEYERNSRYSVITHGDAWTNNIMFRFKENNPVELILIDYQISKFGSPVNDLEYMIFGCTDYNTREQHYYEWIEYYHSELAKSLKKFDMKASDVYPREQLNNDLKRYSKVYLATVIILHSMLIRKSEDAAKVKDAMNKGNLNEVEVKKLTESLQISRLDPESVALFKKKIEEMIESFSDFGYLE